MKDYKSVCQVIFDWPKEMEQEERLAFKVGELHGATTVGLLCIGAVMVLALILHFVG